MTGETKERLRARFRAYREDLEEEAYAQRSAAIVRQVQTLPELASAQTIHTYWPLMQRHEVDIRPLISWLQASGKQIVMPMVLTFNNTSGQRPRMQHRLFSHQGKLVPNRWGIHEPVGGTSVGVTEIEAVIVPALGAGRDGNRIGHGYGYYDAFLKTLSVDIPTIGLVYAACLVDTVPVDPHDIALTVVVTEEEIVRPRHDVTS